MLNRNYVKTGKAVGPRARGPLEAFAQGAAIGLFIAFAAGCGKSADHTPTVQIDPTFSPYVSRFEAASVQAGHPTQVTDLVIQFGDLGSDTSAASGVATTGEAAEEAQSRGVCDLAQDQTPVITISRAAWDSSTDAEREELVFHELGHCVLGLKHVAGVNAEGIPTSIMDPAEISGPIYKQYRSYYLQTLFGP